MYEVSFFNNKTLEPGLFVGNEVLRVEIKPFKFARKLFWFPTTLNTNKILNQSYFPELLLELKKGAYLIYDISSEPGNISWIDELLDPLILVLKENNISLKKLLVLSATPKILFGNCEYGYLFFNEIIYNTCYRFKKSKETPIKTHFKKHFLSLSRKDTLARRYLNYLLHTENLFDKGFVSHGRGGMSEEHKDLEMLPDLEIAKQDLIFLRRSINKIWDIKKYLKYGLKKHYLDTTDMSLKNVSLSKYYNYDIHFKLCESVPLELVNETYAHGSDALFLTEKAVKAMLSKSLFLLLGNPFLLSFVKQLGFKTFPHLFDESYDNETDFVKRTKAVLKNLQEFCKIPLSDCKKIYDDNAEILDYNYNHLINTKWDFSIKSRIEKYITKESLQ